MKNVFLSAGLFVLMTVTMSAINCKRSIQVVAGKEVHVEITIHKDKSSGFARLAEYIPDGAEIKYAKTDGGTFDIQGKRLKFIWISMPQKDEFTVSYTVNPEAMKEGNYAIYGKFNYVEGDETKEVEIASSTFDIKGKTVALASNKTSKDISTSVAAVTKTAAPAPVTASSSAVTNNIAANNSTVAASAKVTYGLQLLTTKEK